MHKLFMLSRYLPPSNLQEYAVTDQVVSFDVTGLPIVY